MKWLVNSIIYTSVLLSCHPRGNVNETYIEAAIPVVDERLSLSPLISEARMEDLPNWPKNPREQKILLKNFNKIWGEVLAEFRRCQKLGLYIMVEDTDNPTIRISIVLTDIEYINDTLYLPVRLQVERLRDDQRFIYTLPAKASVGTPMKKASPYHYYGVLLTKYRKKFPHKDIVSFFYRHPIATQ